MSVEWTAARPLPEGPSSTVAGGELPSRPASRRVSAGLIAHAIVPPALAAIWAVAIRSTPLADMSDLGLVSVMPAAALAALAALSVSFCASLARRPLGPVVPLVHVLVLIVVLYGVTAFLEPEPRFAAVWKHVGIIDYLLTHGTVDPNIDAYFSWPGFFGLGALLTKLAGEDSALAFAAWGSLAFNLLFLPALLAIFRTLTADPRRVWLGVWIFYSANWVGQDYLSPQATAFLLWLAILAILLRWFTGRVELVTSRRDVKELCRELASRAIVHPRRLWARSAARFAPRAERPVGATRRVAVLLLVIVIFAAMVVGHQLTPFAVILSVIALVGVARLEVRTLPIVMIVLAAAWLTYMTTTYLAGNLASLTSPLGSLGQNVDQNVGARLEGSAQHLFIVHVRMIASAAVWLLAAAGFARRLAHGRVDVAMAAIGLSPFLLPILQPYGGEMFLRVFLFTLPAAAYLLSGLVFPSSWSGRGVLPILGACCLSLALLASFMYCRYGNERMDNYTRGDVAAVGALYAQAPHGSTLIAGAGNVPWQNRDYADYQYDYLVNLPSWYTSGPDVIARQFRRHYATDRTYLIVTPSAEAAASLLDGRPGVLARVVSALREMPGVTETYSAGGSTILRLDPEPGAPAPSP